MKMFYHLTIDITCLLILIFGLVRCLILGEWITSLIVGVVALIMFVFSYMDYLILKEDKEKETK